MQVSSTKGPFAYIPPCLNMGYTGIHPKGHLSKDNYDYITGGFGLAQHFQTATLLAICLISSYFCVPRDAMPRLFYTLNYTVVQWFAMIFHTQMVIFFG